jgi:hypothetical protein
LKDVKGALVDEVIRAILHELVVEVEVPCVTTTSTTTQDEVSSSSRRERGGGKEAAGTGLDVVDEQLGVQVIDLVLEHGRDEAARLEPSVVALRVHVLHSHVAMPPHFAHQPCTA